MNSFWTQRIAFTHDGGRTWTFLPLQRPTAYEIWAGDVNGDETVDILDIDKIVNMILGNP